MDKVKFILEQALKAQTCSAGTDLLFIKLNTRRKSVVSVTPRTIYLPKRTSVPIVQGAGWAQAPI